MSAPPTISRDQVLRFRVAAQQLDRSGRHRDAAILDLGAQDTGPDGARWALEIRGAHVPDDDLVLAWTLRGAPHAYRRSEVAQVATAVAPWSEADAAKRIFDAARQLKKAGIPVLDALDHVAAEMREIAARPVTKGEMSGALTDRLGDPYVRWCERCRATHTYEQPFRLSALQAGLELEPGTSPPVLRRIPRWRGAAKTVPEHLDLVRAVLRLFGPASPKMVSEYVDATVRDVKERWPEDIVAVEVEGTRLDVLADDVEALLDPPTADGTRLLGPFDLFLQGRDRALVVRDPDARSDLWRTIGRPGGVLVGSEVVGSWRPRSKGDRLQVAVTVWDGSDLPDGVEEQAERLAAFRGQAFSGFVP
ncbi:hypothetical protein ASC77_11965 [Nocardioides sp. Root1257]|uniref:DNA glycosylase AlkZ-like family protein n=1 Tax=unclassified Nocardioides TaxID=2615069 RepID=UPI0006F450D8|nr:MULTISPECIES: crosslink repair DNA glycosylase YcaQ family protein [unclassified Nocardioides]KQW49381.1 hypothetical protein ASC77_11965 [Nocardioides sp. Root1257]KRC48555.1 hypothetical protein ASE24_11970 [Nocardioides sp. Root224]